MAKKDKSDFLKKIIEKYKKEGLEFEEEKSDEDKSKVFSREYKIYKEEEKIGKLKLYENLCDKASKILKVKADKKTEDKLNVAIKFTGLNVTPTSVVSLTILSTAFLFFIAAILIILQYFLVIHLPTIFLVGFLLVPVITALSILYYPINYANVLRIRSGGDLVIAVLYMIVYMKSVPNLEGAVRFAAKNVGGKLSLDLKEVLWKVGIGEYNTVDEGLSAYILEWRDYNREFVESIQLIRESMIERSASRRDALLDKAVDIVLTGTDEKMKRYSRDLKTPVEILHGLGILLPVLGMVVFPLMSVFMADTIQNLALYLFFGYNIFLPLIVYFIMKNILDKRPATHSKIDISEHPDVAPLNLMKIKNTTIPVWPFAVLIGLLIMLPGIMFIMGTNLSEIEHGIGSMLRSMFIIWGISIGLIIYYFGTSFQKIKIRNEIEAIEDEFGDALFALGNRASGGIPIEVALTEAEEDTKELHISELFRICLKNINRLNMTFKQSLFDKKYGALIYYPSKLIRTIMKSVSESVVKGTKAASTTMLTISRYLINIHTTQEKIEDLLSPTTSSMKFQAYVLLPVISGVVVAIAQLIMGMMFTLGLSLNAIPSTAVEGMDVGIEGILPGIGMATPPELLQLIVGFYVIEMLVLLGMFVNRIEVGEDKIKENYTMWKILLVGTIMYTIILLLVMGIFSPLISTASTLAMI